MAKPVSKSLNRKCWQQALKPIQNVSLFFSAIQDQVAAIYIRVQFQQLVYAILYSLHKQQFYITPCSFRERFSFLNVYRTLTDFPTTHTPTATLGNDPVPSITEPSFRGHFPLAAAIDQSGESK